jgi:hypothetical protein
MVAAKLKRIRVIVMIRRDQRSEVGNEIRVVINMDIPLMPATMCMFYPPHFDHEADGCGDPPSPSGAHVSRATATPMAFRV